MVRSRTIKERGQATIEAIGLWASVAIAIGTAAALVATSPLPAVVAAAISRRGEQPEALSPLAGTTLDRALATGRPSLLAARVLVTGELGAQEGMRLIAGRVIARVASDPSSAGALDVTELVIPVGQTAMRLLARPIGSLTLVAIATVEDELPPGHRPSDVTRILTAAGAAAGLIGVVGSELPDLARVATRAGGSVVGALSIAQVVSVDLTLGAPPGRRAGDAILCRPVDIRWSSHGRLAGRASAIGHELLVLRAGRLIARFVPPSETPCPPAIG